MRRPRRSACVVSSVAVGCLIAIIFLGMPARAADKTVSIGLSFPITGAEAGSIGRVLKGAQMAIAEANEQGGIAGYKLNPIVLNSATTTAGQYDPAQAALNTRQLVADPTVVACIGPITSSEGKAISPLLSLADLATVTPEATNPDITSPKFASTFRPNGKAIFFRMVATDAYQGPEMANFMYRKLNAKSVYVIDDSSAYAVGIADSFQAQAEKLGVKVLGRDQVNSKATDFSVMLTKVAALKPEAIYYGASVQAGVKLVKQTYDAMPKVMKLTGDGLFGPDVLTAAGFPAAENLYVSIASPHLVENPDMRDWIARFVKRFNTEPDDYAITSYDAAMVILDAIKRTAESGKEVNRSNVRDAIQATKLKTLQGEVSFDENGDINQKVISVFEIVHDTNYHDDDVLHQYKYVGVAPTE